MRRFALGMALVLVTWAMAGVDLEQPLRVSPFGLPFRVGRPDLLPLGIALAVLYGCLRYYYYAIMLSASPYRRRRDLLDQLRGESQSLGPSPKPGMYIGPTELTSTPWRDDYKGVDSLGEEIKAAFPKFARARVTAERMRDARLDDEGTVFFALKMHIPTRCRIAALAQDIDYASPVWFSALALGIWVWSLR